MTIHLQNIPSSQIESLSPLNMTCACPTPGPGSHLLTFCLCGSDYSKDLMEGALYTTCPVCDWFILLYTMSSRFIHVEIYARISFLQNCIPQAVYPCIHQRMDLKWCFYSSTYVGPWASSHGPAEQASEGRRQELESWKQTHGTGH